MQCPAYVVDGFLWDMVHQQLSTMVETVVTIGPKFYTGKLNVIDPNWGTLLQPENKRFKSLKTQRMPSKCQEKLSRSEALIDNNDLAEECYYLAINHHGRGAPWGFSRNSKSH